MKKLIVFIMVGFIAQLIDGSLGMAYGVTSTTLLLAFGIAPAVASASVHLAEVVTTAASGASHLKFGNVDRDMVLKLIIPGSIGAFVGACFLSHLPGDLIKPYISTFLLILGLYIIYRFLFLQSSQETERVQKMSNKQLVPLGLLAGFFDATGGGGWGPIATPVLLAKKGVEARKVVGTVDTSEFAVAVSATLGFFISLGWEEVNWFWVGTLMLGGIIAAPIAAWIVRIMPSHLLGVLVGGLIVLTNARTLLHSWNVAENLYMVVYSIIIAGWVFSVWWAIRNHKKRLISDHLAS
ncbi:sulfite exporter TauE/SafE family protein [Anoxybacillus sp. B7M1]|uniref:sulfite exporter TauE/SafE family protein n=1 Tax=unclassified Anoxybacillus TaxID=2639704 RepID=UPI0005CD2692|nr:MULTISPECIES: sulfite exporter TauE/SafE family protein [unclassified Anoxybacillus]ANB55907.1 sulfite exporter TauE/SafE family protein [Anoxybacillus sp. B2M1]ANB65457.1 sulfite exporter TauE/SafE family protein [Anoxybacillus sp. B7M1]